MDELKRTSDAKEDIAFRTLMCFLPGGVTLAIAAVLFVYASGWTLGLRWVLLMAGTAVTAYGFYHWLQIRKVGSYDVVCPFCEAYNDFTEPPQEDVRCRECNREIPIQDGNVLRVYQVRCGYCNTLNWYSDKSTGLLCEQCDREIPISVSDEVSASPALKTFSRQDDNLPFDLYLIDPGKKIEEFIPVLQQMLALNRNHVKKIVEEVPVLLLQGIPKRKADMLVTQIQVHGGVAEARPSTTA